MSKSMVRLFLKNLVYFEKGKFPEILTARHITPSNESDKS